MFEIFKKFLQIKSGSRRFVIIFKDRVYKIPKMTNWVSFIRGINENLEERYWWSADGSRKREPNAPWRHEHLAEIFWADRFGFIVIMERLDTSLTQDKIITKQVERDFNEIKEWAKGYRLADDLNLRNVGYRGEEMLILDYGYFGGTMDCYIGT